MITEPHNEEQLFEKGLYKIFNRINDMIKNGEDGFASYFVSGHSIHDRQDALVADYYGISTEIERDFVVVSGEIAALLLVRSVTFSPPSLELIEDDSPVQTGVEYRLQRLDII